MALAQETGTFVFNGLRSTAIPGIAVTKMHCWENALQFDVEALASFVERLLEKPRQSSGGS